MNRTMAKVDNYIRQNISRSGRILFCSSDETRNIMCEDVKAEFPDVTDKMLRYFCPPIKQKIIVVLWRFIVRCFKCDLLTGVNNYGNYS